MKRFVRGQVKIQTKEKFADDDWKNKVVPKLDDIIKYCDQNKLAIEIALSDEGQIFFNFNFVSLTRALCNSHLKVVKDMFKSTFNGKAEDIFIAKGDKLF